MSPTLHNVSKVYSRHTILTSNFPSLQNSMMLPQAFVHTSVVTHWSRITRNTRQIKQYWRKIKQFECSTQSWLATYFSFVTSHSNVPQSSVNNTIAHSSWPKGKVTKHIRSHRNRMRRDLMRKHWPTLTQTRKTKTTTWQQQWQQISNATCAAAAAEANIQYRAYSPQQAENGR